MQTIIATYKNLSTLNPQSTCKLSTSKMSIEGTFQHVKNENLLEYYKSLGKTTACYKFFALID